MSKTGLHKLKGNSQHPELKHVKSQRWSNILHFQAANVIPHWLWMFMMEEVRDTDAIPLSLKHLRNPPNPSVMMSLTRKAHGYEMKWAFRQVVMYARIIHPFSTFH